MMKFSEMLLNKGTHNELEILSPNSFDIMTKSYTKDNYTTSEYSTWDEKLIIRCISKDSYNLKFAINKILSYFFKDSQIPKIWHI